MHVSEKYTSSAQASNELNTLLSEDMNYIIDMAVTPISKSQEPGSEGLISLWHARSVCHQLPAAARLA